MRRRRFLQLTASGVAVAAMPAVVLAEPRRKLWTGPDLAEPITAMDALGVSAEQAAADCQALADQIRRPAQTFPDSLTDRQRRIIWTYDGRVWHSKAMAPDDPEPPRDSYYVVVEGNFRAFEGQPNITGVLRV